MVAMALVAKRGIGRVRIRTDSRYVVDGIRGAQRRLTNLDLWSTIDVRMQQARVLDNEIEWIAAHAGDYGNGVADIAAREAERIAQQRVAYDPALDGWPADEQVQPPPGRWVIA